MSHLWCCTNTQISPSEAGRKRGLLSDSHRFPSKPSLSAGRECVHTYRTTTDPLDVHMGPTRDQMLLLCRLCRLSHILMNHYPKSSPPLLLNNQAYGLCCLATVPTTVHQGPRGWNSPSPWSPSNLMITITCSLSAAPHSRWFVSNWPVPFAWLFWLLHFSLSPLRWLLWHYRCWVSLITPLIGLEVLHASLFWGKAAVCCERQNISACFSHFKR